MAKQQQLSPDDIAVVTVMAEYALKPGQMLLLGPKSIAMITGAAEFKGRLPDKHVIDKKEWNR